MDQGFLRRCVEPAPRSDVGVRLVLHPSHPIGRS